VEPWLALGLFLLGAAAGAFLTRIAMCREIENLKTQMQSFAKLPKEGSGTDQAA
jgi:hypothetical protein